MIESLEILGSRINGEMVSPPLKCHIDRGYTDGSNAMLAGAFDAVNLDCATGVLHWLYFRCRIK